VYNQFVIRALWRDDLRSFLASKGIDSEVYYPVPFHLQACFAGLGYRVGDFPRAEKAAREALALPIYPELPSAAVEHVVSSVCEFIGRQAKEDLSIAQFK
jgi:dTDP-4-amino-4,6-dideoxygalactose transaminase